MVLGIQSQPKLDFPPLEMSLLREDGMQKGRRGQVGTVACEGLSMGIYEHWGSSKRPEGGFLLFPENKEPDGKNDE